MSFAPQSESAPDLGVFAKPEALLLAPIGLASPLWGLFAGAAVSGATWWWMTSWMRPQNLEAMFATPEALAPASAPVLEALVDPAPQLEPVGGEAAPISPVVETLAPPVSEPAADPEPRSADPVPDADTKPKKRPAPPVAADPAEAGDTAH